MNSHSSNGLSRFNAYLLTAVIIFSTFQANGEAAESLPQLPLQVGEFQQQRHMAYSQAEGLPSVNILRIACDSEGTIHAETSQGFSHFNGTHWLPTERKTIERISEEHFPTESLWFDTLADQVRSSEKIRAVANHDSEIAVAAENGLFIGDGKSWTLALPQEGKIRWAPVDVRAVTYDSAGQLWFACPQGVGFRTSPGEWKLFTGADGLPFNDFTCMAAGPQGIWFGTTNGAIHYSVGDWKFRQGRRWLIHNHVRDIAIDRDGTAWIATPAGISRIESQSTTLRKKAAFYEDEIEKYHRRTSFGYVNPAVLTVAGDKSTAVPAYSDNDGFNTGLYLCAMSHAYTVTKDPKYQKYAEKAFQALAFLSKVTQGGTHPAPVGFIARNVIPTSDPNPNQQYNLAYDIRRNKADTLWKIIQPRLPVDESGKWYWKCDSSSDELDGHFLGYATYFDHVCESEKQKNQVRNVVRTIIDHILRHNYSLVDHDGHPTRWARFSPEDINRNEAWCDERGLNSFSILTYLTVAHHITGDSKYRDIYLKLALDDGYGMNGMTQPKSLPGPNSPGHQPDDNMAFINYYHLIRYETDPKLLSMFQHAMRIHWQYERLERNSFTNFIYSACAQGKIRRDQWGEIDLSPPLQCYEDAVETLKRYPLNLVEWPMSNAHRIDLVPLGDKSDKPAKIGSRIDGYAFPIDERHEIYWDWDPWALTSNYNGKKLRPGFHYLIAYYLGRVHEFIVD